MAHLKSLETRVLFIGEPSCGKRSLLHNYIFDQVIEADAEEELSSATTKQTKPQVRQDEFIKDLHIDNKTLTAHFIVKDIPITQGQLIFDERENKYDCYVILFDMGLWPDSGNRARLLFNSITNPKKLMVGCKSDLFQKSRARRTHCVPCSVVNNHNVDNVFEQVTEILQFQDASAHITPVLRTPSFRPESDPTQRRSKRVRKSIMRKVNRLRSTGAGSGGRVLFDAEYAADQEADLDRDFSSSENKSISLVDEDSELVKLYDDIMEHELPENLDSDEKPISGNDNIVSAHQLLQAAWHQNVKSFTQSLKTLKQHGADFKICDAVNASGDTILHELVRRQGWVAHVEVILQKNILSPNELTQLLNSKNCEGNTGLHIVASRGRMEYLDLLLKTNIDLLCENERGKTALLIAVEMNHFDIVQKLVEHNRQLTKKHDYCGISAYELAIELEYYDIATFLKPYYENVEDPMVVKKRNEAIATKRKFFELVLEEQADLVQKMLQENPALVHELDSEGRMPIHIASVGRNISTIPQLLLKCNVDINCQDKNGNTPLHLAACDPNGFTISKFLIESNARIDIPNNDQNLPLHMAVFGKNLSLIEYLLNNCNSTTAGIRKANADENTPLHIACAVISPAATLDKIVNLMTDKRAESSALNSRRETPLHIAAAAGCNRVHPSLCDQLTAKDMFGNTPLLSAARSLNLPVVQNLLDMGSSLDTTNFDNENILHLLAFSPMSGLTDQDSLQCISIIKKIERKSTNRELLRQLLTNTTVSTNESPLFYAVSANRFHLVKFFLRRGSISIVNANNIAGNSPLHIAVQRNNRPLVDLLIRKEAKINHPNKEGYTPMHYGCAPSHTQVADRLMKKLKPADLCAVTVEGLSLLHLAAQYGNLHLVQKLVEKTPKKDGTSSLLNLKTQHNNTALTYAITNNHGKVAAYLVKRQALGRSEGEAADRQEFRKTPFPHIYPIINHENVTIVQRLDIHSPTYIIYEGKLRGDDILVLEANSVSSSVCMAHEVAIMSMIGSHPNIQRLLGACANKYCYLPFLPNCSTLDSILSELASRKESCDILQVLTIAEGIANGMKCLHTATVSKPSITHNALTPQAILVDEQNAKLSSFGLARVYFSGDADKEDRNELTLPSVNEVRYLAPEVVRGEPPSKKSDVYSFGMLLWHLCTTNVPYSEILLSDIVAEVRKDNKRPSLEGIDEQLVSLISACWQREPKERPSFENICDTLNTIHVDKVQALGRKSSLPVLKTKTSPFPCCKPREFQIMNKLRKRSNDVSASALYLCTFERIVCVVKMWLPNQPQKEQLKINSQIFVMKSLCECDDVVRFIYSDTDKHGNKCLFMEYMNKGTVAELITERTAPKNGSEIPFTVSELLGLLLPIARALKYMHNFSTIVVHHDIQAENVLMTNRGTKESITKLGGFSSMKTLQNMDEHEIFRDIEGFALYLYQLLTLTNRVKNNWKSQVAALQLPEMQKEFLGILQACLDPIERPNSRQLVERLEAIDANKT